MLREQMATGFNADQKSAANASVVGGLATRANASTPTAKKIVTLIYILPNINDVIIGA